MRPEPESQPLEVGVQWLKGDLFQEVHGLVQRYLIFRAWNDILAISPEQSRTPGNFHNWAARNYLESLASALRRLTDTDTRTVSLVRLLTEVANHAGDLSRSWYFSRVGGTDVAIAEAKWKVLAVPDGAHLDPEIALSDRERLVDICGEVKTYVDQNIAHLDGNRERTGPTIGQAHGALIQVYSMYRKWYTILTGNSIAPIDPIPWEHVLTMAWLTPSQAADVAERLRFDWAALTNTPDVGRS